MATGRAGVNLQAQGYSALKQAAIDLRAAGRGDLVRKLGRNLRGAGKTTQEAVRVAVLATPSKGVPGGGRAQRGGRGLRELIAASTQVSVSTQVRSARVLIRVSEAKFPADQKSLPKYLEGAEVNAYYARWRHPVFGREDQPWVQQDNHPYFYDTIRRHEDDFRRACIRAIEEIVEELGRG